MIFCPKSLYHIPNMFTLGEIEMKMLKESNELGCIQWRCSDCDYVTKHKQVLYLHVESKHTTSSGYNCHQCGKFCPTRNSLKCHISRQHNNKFITN